MHLLKAEENEHVEVHELRGFSSNDLKSALHEVYAVSKGTQAKQFLFSLSLNPPRDQNVSTDTFEATIEKVERKLGLDDQPRAIVFHEKDGRRHAHVVWSRIDADEMKAINLPHYKLKLGDISKELYIEHGWEIPKGFKDSQDRDPANFNLEEWQQAKRAGHDPKLLKMMFKECWAISDSRQAFSHALEEQGFVLAQGDRRGYVAMDYHGEVYSIAKYVGIRASEVKRKIGDAKQLPTLEQAKDIIASRFSDMARKQEQELATRHGALFAPLLLRRQEIVEKQRTERTLLEHAQSVRWQRESQARSERHAKGIRGLWDRVTGKHAEVKSKNEMETLQSFQRDRTEKDDLIFKQQEQRKLLHRQIIDTRRSQVRDRTELRRAIARGDLQRPQGLWERFRDVNPPERANEHSSGRGHDFDLER